MLRTEGADYRRSREAALLQGLRAHDPLALAEVYHRTSPAAHACARRLLGSAREAEALLAAVYAEVWDAPPETARLEGWVRSRTFGLGAAHLREHERGPAAPSLALLLPDLPAPDSEPADAAEQLLAGLDEEDRRALLLAHDQGVPAAAQDVADAAAALDRALIALAGPGEGVDDGSSQECSDLEGLPDWVLGTLAADHAARITAAVVDRPACAARSRALRRGRRRLEGLPPAPDMGHRIIATVLAGMHRGSGAAAPSATSPSPAPAGPPPDRSPAPAPAGPGPAPAPSAPPAHPAPPPPLTAPLPSALDEEPAAPPSAAPAEPAGDAQTDDDVPAAAVDTSAEHVPTAVTDDAEQASFAQADADLAHRRRDASDTADLADGPGFAPDAEAAEQDLADADRADAEDADTDETPAGGHAVGDGEGHTVSATSPAPARGSKHPIARRLLNVAAILAVLAAGSAIGLLIGFLLVGGR